MCGADLHQQNHSSKRGGAVWQATGDSWGDDLPLGRPGYVADDGWMVGEPAQEKQNFWDTNFFGRPETRRHQPVARFVYLAFGNYLFLVLAFLV